MKPESQRLSLTVGVRVPIPTHRKLVKKAQPHGGISAVVRELIDAYLENRLTIQPRTKGII